MPYICEGTIVRDTWGREGKVIMFDQESKVAVVRVGAGAFAEHVKNLEVVSYKEVK